MHSMKCFRASLIGVALLGSAVADEARQATPAEREVMQVTQDACQAFLKADIPAAEALLLPGFTLVNSRAVVQSRDDVLRELRDHDPVYSEFRNHSMSAQVFRDAAIVQGITTVKGKSGENTFAVDVRFTDTLIRQNGTWRLIVSHVTRIP